MQTNKTVSSIGRVLLTRPRQKNNQLAAMLIAEQFEIVNCPMIEIVPLVAPNFCHQLNQLSPNDIIIAVSAPAVNFSKEIVSQWPKSVGYYAIGEATAEAMREIGVTVESPKEPITESLLKLSSLQSLKGRRVLILRGVGGRETLAEQLKLRGAIVEYCELYRRQAIRYDPIHLLQSWKNHNVKTIVVTSGEILKNLLTLVGTVDKRWLICCNLVVPSARVARLASAMGFSRCYVAAGADNTAISQTLMKIQSDD